MSRRRYLDTNRLIAHWRRCRKQPITEYSPADATVWARLLIRDDGTDAILTPVAIEFLCGTMNPHEPDLTRAFLDQFQIIEKGEILAEDWEQAKRFAAWVPRDAKPRDLADCLLAAIARRLGYDPLTSDVDHQRQSGSAR